MTSETDNMGQESEEKHKSEQKKSRCDEFRAWFGGAHFCVYMTYVMGAWGDRMWMFAAGLYLVSLADGVLRLAAVLGFTGGSCILLLGGVIGNWVDENPRLKVVRITLLVQNLSVALCAVSVCLTLYYTEEIHQVYGGYLKYLSESLIIILAILASLASVAYKIAIEKDWIIIVAGEDSAQLANLNARMRAIDLLCSLLAPLTVGLIMSYTSLVVSAIVIAAWNVFSVVVEYALLTRVYHLVPRLAVKEELTVELDVKGEALQENGGPSELATVPSTESNTDASPDASTTLIAPKQKLNTVPEENTVTPEPAQNGTALDQNQSEPVETSSLTNKPSTDTTTPINPADKSSSSDADEPTKKKKSCGSKLFQPFVTFVNGWKTYARQKVVFASLSLAFLYMTVLGLDSVTTGYIYATGVAEVWVGVSIGLSGLAGVLGTFVFTWLRKRNGLERTGLVAFNLEILCLCFCVVSVWAPGSPFDPFFKLPPPGLSPVKSKTLTRNCSYVDPVILDGSSVVMAENARNRTKRGAVTLEELNHHMLESHYTQNIIGEMLHRESISDSFLDTFHRGPDNRVRRNVLNETIVGYSEKPLNSSLMSTDECEADKYKLNVAIMLLLIGLVTSRTGLWMADLTITQLMQENVAEKERGIVNGVQNSLNMFMDMLKFALVIVIPYVETYGYLVMLSFAFICMGGMLFAYHSWRVRGHLFHFEKICGPRFSHNHETVMCTGVQRPRDPSIELCAV